jgi:two-component system alkaline phosphatase synthesis response regulator PhoP
MAAREKILIVDDDRDLVATLRLVLEKAGYDVAEANEPEAALAAVEEKRPDLILLDIMMPNSTEGFQFIWRLRRRPEEYYHRLPVIMISAAAEQTGLRFYPESGDGTYPAGASVPVQDFLDKPIEPAHLLDKIQKALVAAWRKR